MERLDNIYSSSLSPSMAKARLTGEGGDNDFPRSKIMETSEFAVLDSGKDYIDPESLKKLEDKEMLLSIWHLFITLEDNDRLIAEGQDGEQGSNDEQNDASDADKQRHSYHKLHSHPSFRAAALLAKKRSSQTQI